MKFVSVKLSDTSGTIKNEITLGNSYKVENVGIKEFNVKYLSTSPSALITQEADIGPVKEEDLADFFSCDFFCAIMHLPPLTFGESLVPSILLWQPIHIYLISHSTFPV
jgi:hypothetical protein